MRALSLIFLCGTAQAAGRYAPARPLRLSIPSAIGPAAAGVGTRPSLGATLRSIPLSPSFDGRLPARGQKSAQADFVPSVGPAGAVEPRAWTEGRFASPADGSPVSYRSRPPGDGGGAVRVFVGGMALAGSYEAYFRSAASGRAADYLLVMRGLPPSPYTRIKDILAADARDLARMIVSAAEQRGAESVELVLHSYSSLVLQRLFQLAEDKEVAAAIRLLRAGRVVWIGATTHYRGSESVVGPEFEWMSRNVRMTVAWIDAMDAQGESLRAAARLNPLLWPQVSAWLAGWELQRAATIRLASEPQVELLRKHLSGNWGSEAEPVRRELAAALERDSADTGWREGAMRRLNGTLELEFTAEDAARMRDWGIKVDILYGAQDQLIPWRVERIVLERLGIPAPEEIPPPGTVLRDESGLFSITIADGDHYLPLKRPADFGRWLSR